MKGAEALTDEEDKIEVQDIGGFKFVNVGEENIPEDLAKVIMEALVTAGQLVLNEETGEYMPSPLLMTGKFQGMSLSVSDDGELEHFELLTEDDLPQELKSRH